MDRERQRVDTRPDDDGHDDGGHGGACRRSRVDQFSQPEGPGATPRTVQEQLGLKLDSQRAPVETLVIDSAARPTED
ncbi:MAG TPA: DUF3738 domain-containing protein [Vicinamibacterales bacterium]|nr:DUF3738 domain-containing protein [Vicinamibacterales bacterium]